MLKKVNKPIILAVEDYIELFGKPNDSFGEQDQLLLARFIEQATDQFDSLISTHNGAGYLYKWFKELKDNDVDNMKGYKLQKSIGSWVETMIQTGKYWVDGVPQMSSNIDYTITGSYGNSNIEKSRKDIIQDLVAIGLTQTTNITNNNNNDALEQEIEEQLIIGTDYVNSNFLMLDSRGQEGIKSPINMNSNPIVNAGDISNTNINGMKITNFILEYCTIRAKDGNLIESERTDKIWDTKDNSYKYLSDFNVDYFGGLTKQQTYQAIISSGTSFQMNNVYVKDYIVIAIHPNTNVMEWFRSKIDNNVGNNPFTSPNEWEKLNGAQIDISGVIEQLKPFIVSEVQTQVPIEINKHTNDNPIYKQNEIIESDSLTFKQDFENTYGAGSLVEIESDIKKQVDKNTNDILINANNITTNTNTIATNINDINTNTSYIQTLFDLMSKLHPTLIFQQDNLSGAQTIGDKIIYWISNRGTITSLDTSLAINLFSLDCSSNNLTTLDLRNNTQLTDLRCSGNQLTTLDLTNNTQLTLLYCDNIQLTSLDLRNNTQLKYLRCYNNQLTTLDLRNNTQLTSLYCDNIQLTTLDLRFNDKLETIFCRNNPNLTKIILPKEVEDKIWIRKDAHTIVEYI